MTAYSATPNLQYSVVRIGNPSHTWRMSPSRSLPILDVYAERNQLDLPVPGVTLNGCLKPWVQARCSPSQRLRGASQGPGLQQACCSAGHKHPLQLWELCLRHVDTDQQMLYEAAQRTQPW
jgi:hypothetical protein